MNKFYITLLASSQSFNVHTQAKQLNVNK